jgi:hypothetical protein
MGRKSNSFVFMHDFIKLHPKIVKWNGYKNFIITSFNFFNLFNFFIHHHLKSIKIKS